MPTNATHLIIHLVSFPKQILSPSTTSPLLFLKVKFHLSLLPVHLYCHPPQPPDLGKSRWSRPFVSDTIPRGTHTSYWSPRERHLQSDPFANKIHWTWKVFWQRELDTRAWYTHWMHHRQASAKGHRARAFHMDQRWEGRKAGLPPPGRAPRPNDAPGLPPSRCSTNQNSSVPQGITGKIPYLPHFNQAAALPKSTWQTSQQKGIHKVLKCSSLKHRLRG